jgi:hypothetical protein
MNVIKHILYIFFILLAIAIPSSATTYCVSTTGSNAASGIDPNCWLTISYAVGASSATAAGDTINVKSGTYNERVVFSKQGSAGSGYLTVQAESLLGVTIDGTGISYSLGNGLVQMQNKAYIKLNGLRVKNTYAQGIRVDNSSNIEINNSYTYNTGQSGIKLFGSLVRGQGQNRNVSILNTEILYAKYTSWQEEALSMSALVDGMVDNVTVSYGTAEGIDCKDGCINVTIKNSRAYNNNAVGLYIDGYADNQHDILVDNVTISGTKYAANIIIGAESNGTTENVTIRNSRIMNGQSGGIQILGYTESTKRYGKVKNILIQNNVIWNNKYSGISVGTDPNSYLMLMRNVTLSNNIINKTSDSITVYTTRESETFISNNILDPVNATSDKGNPYWQSSANFVNENGLNFHIQNGSIAVDNGNSTYAPPTDFEGTARPQGTKVDIGIHELASASGFGSKRLEYTFEQDSGSTVYDSSGNAINGTFNGNTTVTHITGLNGTGTAARLDGVNDYISFSNSTLKLNTNASVGFTVRSPGWSPNSTQQYIFDCQGIYSRNIEF